MCKNNQDDLRWLWTIAFLTKRHQFLNDLFVISLSLSSIPNTLPLFFQPFLHEIQWMLVNLYLIFPAIQLMSGLKKCNYKKLKHSGIHTSYSCWVLDGHSLIYKTPEGSYGIRYPDKSNGYDDLYLNDTKLF